MKAGVLAIEVEPRADGGADFVSDNLYCVLMYARSRMKRRASLSAILEDVIARAASIELLCVACCAWCRHLPIPGERPLYRCAGCTMVREHVRRRVVAATDQPTETGAQLVLFLALPPVDAVPRARAPRRAPPPAIPQACFGFAA